MELATHQKISMILYGIEFLPLIWELQEARPMVSQHWYYDDAGAIGTFPNILSHLDGIMV